MSSFHRPGHRAGVTALAVIALGLAPALLAPAAQADAPAAPVSVTLDTLQTNGRTDPLGIPADAPSLSWHAHSDARGVAQTGYEVRVASSVDKLDSPDVWDSGQVQSDRQVDVSYAGPALTSQTRYVWQVRTWDNGSDTPTAWSDPASFETGITDDSQWQGDWITGSTSQLADWQNYTTTVDFHLDSLAFGLFFRGATNNNAYMWQLTTSGGTPALKIHKLVNGGFQVVESKDISSFISAQDLLAGDHTLKVDANGSTITTYLDGTQIDQRSDSSFSDGYVGLRTSVDTDGTEALTVHSIDVTSDEDGSSLLSTSFDDGKNPFSAGTVSGGDLKLSGNAVGWYAPVQPLPLLRDQFSTEAGKTIADARLYASARGVYQLSIDGKPVGDEHLAPGSTTYTDRIQSQTYDVTSLLADGDNAIGAELGAGWYAGRDASLAPGYWGTDESLIAQLRIDYTDGTSQTVATDPSWTTHGGPFLQADNIDGETYDANYAQPGFDTTGFDAAAWKPVTVAQDTTSLLVPQPDAPVRTTDTLHPVGAPTDVTPDSWVYDLGQNMVGVTTETLTGHAGDTIRIRYGEVLNKDGTLYTANLRSAKATDYYTFATDGTVTYTPTFTFHGFRYVEITNLSDPNAAPPAVGDVTGDVWGSDLAATGTLQTSDSMLNQLTSNISWGQRDNFLSIPTDTPARDERLGWLGDINVFSPTASYLRDDRAFMEKFTADMRDAQFSDGSLPGVAPYYTLTGGIGGTAWEDAMVTVPYAVFNAYGDTQLIEQNWDAMTKFMGHVETSAGSDLVDTGRNVYGDWLTLESDTPAGVIGTAYYAEDAHMMSQMAAAIGDTADAASYDDLAGRVRAAFAQNFIQPDGTVGNGTQTGYALALGMGLVPQDQIAAVGAKYVAKIHASDDHLTTGFVGTPWLLPALTAIGQNDLAYQLLENKTYPSWGYEIANGATTTWERWNSIMPDGSFGDVSMNSFNHYAYGAVGDWMYQNIGGIAPLTAGYKESRIAPVIGGGLTHASGQYDSAYGTIATDWKVTGSGLTLHVEVPVNTTAAVVIPAANPYAVSESGHLLADAPGVSDVAAADGNVTVTVGSGTYDFTVTDANGRLGTLVQQLSALGGHVDDLATSGDLSSADHDQLASALSTVSGEVQTALLDNVGADDAGVVSALSDAASGVQQLRSWLTGSDVDGPVRGDLDGRLAPIENGLVTALTSALGVTVTLPPVSGAVQPGSAVSGTVDVADQGADDLSEVTATVSVDGWGSTSASVDKVAAGASAALPVSLSVPRHQAPGAYDAALVVRLTRDGTTFTLTDTTAGWASVTSGVTIGSVTTTPGADLPAEHATMTVPVTNTGSDDVTAHVVASLPDGWTSVPSAEQTIPAGSTASLTVPVIAPLDVVGGAIPATVSVVQSGVTLASSDQSMEFDLPTPPTPQVLDHVDFGDSASENAHAIEASASSGTNTEAGLTRRYANSADPGAWYSVQVSVPDGKPFILRDIETFDGAHTKKYDVYVNDTLVKTQLVPRSESGQGTKTYDALIDDPSVLTGDGGSVRIKFEYPLDASGYYDPSIADLWVLGVPDDTQAPDASAYVSRGTPGDGGWYRSDVAVSVAVGDNRDATPAVQTGTDAGWQQYAGPVTLSGEGKHTLSYRATDAAGNRAQATLPVWIDETAPTTTLKVATGASRPGRATLEFAASDALSGVAQTVYRIDGGGWKVLGESAPTVSGFGDHTVEYASTDVAGNAEMVHSTTVTLADVDALAALVPPQVAGVARIGSMLSSTTGSWNTDGVALARQWLRNGTAIKGATGRTYRLGAADLGKRISVRVTASKAGESPATAVSAATAPVAKASSATHAVVRASGSRNATVTVTVSASGVTPTGRVSVAVDGRTLASGLLHGGRVTVRVKLPGRARHTIVARYPGSSSVAASSSPKVHFRR